jgi:hypothetical protein
LSRLRTKAGGKAEIVLLAELGMKGASHMLMQDRNSLDIAAWLAGWTDNHVGNSLRSRKAERRLSGAAQTGPNRALGDRFAMMRISALGRSRRIASQFGAIEAVARVWSQSAISCRWPTANDRPLQTDCVEKLA